jgi:hypothetical protein
MPGLFTCSPITSEGGTLPSRFLHLMLSDMIALPFAAALRRRVASNFLALIRTCAVLGSRVVFTLSAPVEWVLKADAASYARGVKPSVV